MISDGRADLGEMRSKRAVSNKKAREAKDVRHVSDNQPKLPKEINRSVSTGDITEADIGANLWQAAQAIDLYEGQPDWKAVAKELTKEQLDCLTAAIEEITKHVKPSSS
jgi:ribosomal protein S15P/S13E